MSIRTIRSVNSEKHVGFLRLLRRHLSASSRTVVEKAYKDEELRVFMVCGEVSGDTIGSRLILMTSLKKLSPVFQALEGTVAVEMQLARLPCVVAYRAHLLNELIIRYKANVPYVSLPNILLDSPSIPSLLTHQASHIIPGLNKQRKA